MPRISGRKVCVIAGVGAHSRRATNRHLGPVARGLMDRGYSIQVWARAVCGTPDSRSVVQALTDVGLAPPIVTVSAAPEGPDPDIVVVHLPAPDDDKETILRALHDGDPVLPDAAAPDLQAYLDDLDQGYLRNRQAEWYAKVFSPTVFVVNALKLNLGLGVTVNPRAIILNHVADGAGVTLGRASHLGADALLNLGSTDFTVGNFTLISSNFAVHAMRHTLTHLSSFAIGKGPFSFFGANADRVEPVDIGHDVWIGDGVKCLSGVHIPDGCVVGAGSVVTRSLEPFGVYAGVPARLIRYRFDREKIRFLRDLAWWHFSFSRLVDIQDNFRKPIFELSLDEIRELF